MRVSMLKSMIAKYVTSETPLASKRIVDYQADQDASQRDYEGHHHEQASFVSGSHQGQHLYVDHRSEDQEGYYRTKSEGTTVSQSKEGIHVGADRDDERQSYHRQDREKGVATKTSQHLA